MKVCKVHKVKSLWNYFLTFLLFSDSILANKIINNFKFMARSCVTCGRGPLKGKSRSHSNIATNKHQGVNLQNKTIDGKKVKICTSCLRSSKKVKTT